MSEARGRPDANHCFVCGPDNPTGLQIEYRMEGDICRASFTPAADHCGYDDQCHGGILFSVLDDVMANWLFLQAERAHTAKCEIRFRKPVAIGTRLELEGRLVKRKGKLVVLSGHAFDGAQAVAEAEATFMVVPD